MSEPRPLLATPCGNLIEADPPTCAVGRHFPEDCRAACAAYLPGLHEQERTRTEIWTRVMGSHRPVDAFNAGKRAEHAERRLFLEPH